MVSADTIFMICLGHWGPNLGPSGPKLVPKLWPIVVLVKKDILNLKISPFSCIFVEKDQKTFIRDYLRCIFGGRLLRFFYLLLQFSRFFKTFFSKMLVRGLSRIIIDQILEFLPTKNLARWPSWCFEKNLAFFGTPTWSVCQIFFVG